MCLDEAARMRKIICSKESAKQRTAFRYQRFCQKNSLVTWGPQTTTLFLADVKLQLSAASAAGHARHLLALRRERRTDSEERRLISLQKEYTAEYASVGAEAQAGDFKSFNDAVAITRALPSRDLRTAAAAMLFLGPRCADLGRMSSEQLTNNSSEAGRASCWNYGGQRTGGVLANVSASTWERPSCKA